MIFYLLDLGNVYFSLNLSLFLRSVYVTCTIFKFLLFFFSSGVIVILYIKFLFSVDITFFFIGYYFLNKISQ